MTNPAKQAIRGAINALDRVFHLRDLVREGETILAPLAGDRAIEYSWVIAHLPAAPADILEVGCVESIMTAACARLGHRVTGVDLREIEYEMPGVRFLQGDITKMDLDERFDCVINASTVEHVGLSGRYGSAEMQTGDFAAMQRMKSLLKPEGQMLLTIPVGRDEVIAPFHRVYGEQRLPELLKGFAVEKEEYWNKPGDRWRPCERREALSVKASSRFYALGLFVLRAG